ncbi:MAG: serpin family protein [Methanoregula sp.]
MEPRTIGLCTIATLAIVLIVFAGCTGTVPVQPASPTVEKTLVGQTPLPVALTDAGSTKAVADANNRFAFDLYSRLAKDNEYTSSNIFFSPFSLSSALAITYEGARGNTADEIRSVFYLPMNDTMRKEGFSGLNAGINSGDPGYTLRTANALWAEKTYPFLTEYVRTAERSYGANITNLDFKGHPEDSRVTINTWVEAKTEDRIKDLIPAGVIDPMTRLVITNAIYFKGDWVKQFDKNKTTDADFRTAPGKTVKVPMMERTDEDAIYLYAENGDLQMLSMPYEHTTGKELSMVVLLPKADNLTTTEASLSADTLSVLQQSATSRRVMVYFPKFTLKTKYSLPDTLGAMGMPTAFTGNADFSGMDGTKDLLISDVIHQAFVDVNEEGTEAAAATAVVMKLAAAPANPEPVPVFRADHPFIFLIQDDETGAILFIGRVVNPAGSQ